MASKKWCWLLSIAVAVGTLVSGCGSSPAVKFYMLSPQSKPEVASSQLAIKVGPADFPRALDRSQIVTRISSTQVAVNQFNVWSAPLESQFLNVLGDDLGNLLGTNSIVTFPNEASGSLDYQILLDVLQFDGAIGGSVSLRTRWSIVAPGRDTLDSGLFDQSIAVEGNGYDALVAGHSKLVSMLAAALAQRIGAL